MVKAPSTGATRPDDGDLAGLLGRSATLWKELLDTLATEFGPVDERWSHSAKTESWSLQLKRRRDKRTILYMLPRPKHFLSAFALGEKACQAARTGGLPPKFLEAIDSAPKYPEGRGVRLEVRSRKDLEGVLRLARIKMAN